ncbi:MAG: DMT family transporter [candidate division Zixibacteria bacterium]|nr:DMT family transporter [candidate division Zixibacteria bacterium]NIR64540.1 DMT family transporter [candidate division Zixibacteria bacterium]NIS16609.1 DMT family transporter [candidate division Zixibacteria bacterium]NIS46317.1 DMT family transporter [candidate division Zixibacteria bacterium]NIT52971.1 DMT family transporter [candidate division Zixibacteria bacterium]
MKDASTGKKIISDIGLLYAAAIWGSTFFIVKGSLEFIDPVILVGYRFIIATLLVALLCIITKRPLFKNMRKGIVLGIFIWLLYIPQTIGLGITTASNSGFITGLFVAFVPIFSFLIFRRVPSLIGITATLISLSGLWILTGGLTDINKGDILTLLAAMTYAIHILYVDKFLKDGDDPVTLCFQQFLFVGIASLTVGGIAGLPFGWGNAGTGWIVLFLAVFPTFSAFFIQVVAQKYTSPIRVSLIFAFEPVFAAIFAWTLGGEKIILHRALGGLLIFLAMIISGLPRDILNFEKRRARPERLNKVDTEEQ